jgi:hypothetical protein
LCILSRSLFYVNDEMKAVYGFLKVAATLA